MSIDLMKQTLDNAMGDKYRQQDSLPSGILKTEKFAKVGGASKFKAKAGDANSKKIVEKM